MFSIYDCYLETALFLIVSADRACKMVGTAWSLLVVYTHKLGAKLQAIHLLKTNDNKMSFYVTK